MPWRTEKVRMPGTARQIRQKQHHHYRNQHNFISNQHIQLVNVRYKLRRAHHRDQRMEFSRIGVYGTY